MAITSFCGSQDGLSAKRVFQYDFTHAVVNRATKFTFMKTNSYDITSFRSPKVCLTQSKIHVFETDRIPKGQTITSSPIMMSFTQGDGNGMGLYIPLEESMTISGTPVISHVASYHLSLIHI